MESKLSCDYSRLVVSGCCLQVQEAASSPSPPLFPAASSRAWGRGMGLTAAPSLAKSCSPRVRLGPWLRLLRRRLFSPLSVSALSASPRITQTPAHHLSCFHSPGGLPAGSLCGDRAPTAPGLAEVEQQPGLSGETRAPGASGNRESRGP